MSNVQAFLSKIAAEHRQMKAQLGEVLKEYAAFRKACEDAPKSITAELDSIPGRRIFYNLSQTLDFTTADAGTRAQPMSFLVSQDGPFVMTHYPLVIWRPSAPANATNFGAWQPVASWPLPTQDLTAGDRIDLSYEFVSGGSQRNFNNLPAGPLFSRPDAFAPLPVPTLFAPNETIQFIPTFERIFFAAPAVPTTGGTLQVTLPGYRIVNM